MSKNAIHFTAGSAEAVLQIYIKYSRDKGLKIVCIIFDYNHY
jgi:hypothetical protein